ncbi:phosphoribosyltransferase-like protein [Mucilaginibacter pedocola]|uniref:PRTase-CE domain-containing protein n=1 Tax=Mucilaginibacter pedocola TaxID=1792845 RepID=A0A1S9PLT3_9SPHI|nr:hypothetical protein [Mucilaginibacter pedocola]OOQ61922.1 hypothetical protein BC343_02345 [Mucilaginibacter pedocola]
MKNEIAQAFLFSVMQNSPPEVVDESRKYFQTMARYKYDDYQQFSPGMRFIERLALWLNQFTDADKPQALKFIREKLVFVSQAEMNLLISSVFPDLLREFLIEDISMALNKPAYAVTAITGSNEYRMLVRQSLFCGMSDGAKMEVFRRANAGVITHEQIYQTYELSDVRAGKMQEELLKDLKKLTGKEAFPEQDQKFKRIFLLDDFSASGTSYLKFSEEEKTLKGKIAALYKSIFKGENFQKVFDIANLKVYVVIYLCTEQAKNQIESQFNELQKEYQNKPELICMHIIPNTDKLNGVNDSAVIDLCNNDQYYDAAEIEDEHIKKGGKDVKLGFGQCALPLVLAHNTPNNAVPLLWSYDTSRKFKGLFPRIPRHKEI